MRAAVSASLRRQLGLRLTTRTMASQPAATLNNGAKMPLLGYGTWNAQPGELEKVLDDALTAGYRHIDTAAHYQNEDAIGQVLHDNWFSKGKLKREDLFIVTKLPVCAMRAESVEKYLTRSLKKLRTNYVDLYLVHHPFGLQEPKDENTLFPMDAEGNFLYDLTTDHLAIWKAMEAQVDAGRARAIGLSNFDQRQIQRILDNCRIRPANLQVELHVRFQQRPLVEFCNSNGITVTAYSPLGSPGSTPFVSKMVAGFQAPDLLSYPVVQSIAEKYRKTPAQILLRHLIQKGIIVIPKSTNPQRIVQNIQIFDYALTAEEMDKINALDQGKAGRIFSGSFWKGVEKHPERPHRDG